MNRVSPMTARRKLGACVLAQRAAAAQLRYGPGESRARVGSAEFDARGAPHDPKEVYKNPVTIRVRCARGQGGGMRARRGTRGAMGGSALLRRRVRVGHGPPRRRAPGRGRFPLEAPRRAARRRTARAARAFEGGEGTGGR